MIVLRPRHRRGDTHVQSGSISITAPPETVWRLITTLDTICEWYDTWDTVQHGATDPRLRVGTTFRLIRHRRGRDDTAECRVTDMTAGAGLQWEQSAFHTPTTCVSFRLMPGHDAGTTELRHTRTWTTP